MPSASRWVWTRWREPSICGGPRPGRRSGLRWSRSWRRCGPGCRRWRTPPTRCSASGSEVSAMLSADPAADPVYFVDDHFVPYSGARPVGKGWDTKRRHAQPGRADTLLTDARGRAVVFGSGEPSGLTSTLPGVLTGLREVLGPDAPVLLAFDRGGAYPAAFTACRQAGADWVTYRRGALVEVTAPARQSW